MGPCPLLHDPWRISAPLGRGHGRPTASAIPKGLTHVDIGISWTMARSATTSDVFNAIAEARRREILDALIAGEKTVGAIVNDLSMSQPQVSKHLRVLSEVGLVRCRAEGRRRLYRLEPARLRPLQEWLAKYERAWRDRLDRMDDYLKELQQQGEPR
jgi:DNA-binding transcriptional ArsR family regulator